MENYTEDLAAIAEATAKFTQAPNPVSTEAPDPAEVTLPGGLVDDDGVLIKYAVIRELNGLDEEAIARAGSTSRSLAEILARGVVSFGSRPATESDLKNLLAGDRDALLLAIRGITFGDDVSYQLTCPKCMHQSDITVDLSKEVESIELKNPMTDRVFDVELRKGSVAKVRLPNAVVQTKMMDDLTRTNPETITILLGGCVLSVDGSPSLGERTARMLSANDRETIVQEILKRNPGPRLGGVEKACEACGTELLLPLSLAELFRL